MFTKALLIIAKNWEQPRCLSIGEWIKLTVVHTYIGILFSDKKEINFQAMKRHVVILHITKKLV